MNKTALTILSLAITGMLSGCVSPTPVLDEHFGDAVRAAKEQQILNPDAGRNTDPVAGLDGPAAKEAITLYHDSFKAPPPVTNVINIGGSITGDNNK